MTPDEDEEEDDDDAAAAAGDYDDMRFAKSILYVSTTQKADAATWLVPPKKRPRESLPRGRGMLVLGHVRRRIAIHLTQEVLDPSEFAHCC